MMASTKYNALSILNPKPRELPGPDNLHHMVASGHDHADAVAIEYCSPEGEIERWTYQQMHRKADSMARATLSMLEAQAGNIPHQKRQIIPILIEQCPLLYIAELAILKAGGAFCPLPLDVPEDRLRFILDDVEATVLLTTSELREKLPTLEPIVIVTVDDVALIEPGTKLPEHVDPSLPAYIMYTSGSTGQPKGVILSHLAATQALLAHDQHIPEFTRFLQFASPTFDVSVFEIFFPLHRGRTLVCGERRRLLNDLPGFINTMDIDAAELTPSVASSLLRGRKQVPSLKLLLTIGEMLKRDVIEEYGGPSVERSILYGMYGPTEATIHCTLQPRFTSDMSASNIGVPLETVSAFVVKPQANDKTKTVEIEVLPIGEEGELAVGGYQLADGYLNRPEQTQKVFVTHPEYGNLYRTGDRVRLAEDGMLECSGRISSGQVKLRGQRIELGEIEYAAGQTPDCQTAVAEIISGSLIVFCVFGSRQSDESMVRESCRKWLPAFMVPADILILDELPYLDSGKVDRKALQAIYKSKKARTKGHHAEEDKKLQPILDVVRKVLGVEVHSGTSLTAAGLDSLSSIRISTELKRAGFQRIDATVILESGTVRDIDAELQRQKSAHEGVVASADLPGLSTSIVDTVHKFPILNGRLEDIDYIYTSTATQSSMLLETARRSQAYCNWIEFEVLSHDNFEKASLVIEQLANAHSILRSGFIGTDEFRTGHAVVVWKRLHPSQIALVLDFSYDYSITNNESLLRPCMFQIKRYKDGLRILLHIHHAQYDQWSVDVLRKDLHDILTGHKLSSRASFENVSRFQNRLSDTLEAEDLLDFWSDLLQDFNTTPVPSIIGRRVPPGPLRSDWYELDCDLTQIRTKAQELQCSVPAIFQSAMAYLIGSYVASTDVTFGVVLSGRHIPVDGIENIFGPCLSTLPLRVDYSSVRTCADLARLVHARNRSMQKHSLTPLVDIKSAVKDLGTSQLFDILFVWQESTIQERNEGAKLVREVDSADQHEYNLVLEFEPSQGGVRVRATYQRSLLPLDQIEHMMTQMNHYVNHIASRPDDIVEKLGSLIPDSTLATSNLNPQEYFVNRNLVRRIEENARRVPSAPAVAFADRFGDFPSGLRSITYEELNHRSNQGARYIRSHAKKDSKLICIYMEKSIDLYIAILATMKAGFGYLPIIPDTPLTRVESIMRQVDIALLICDVELRNNISALQHTPKIHFPDSDLTRFDVADLDIEFPGDRVAYTVFTSGSTGEPKGVPITMQNLLGNLQALSELYAASDGDRMLQACSHAFDVSVFEIFFTFYNALCLCSARKEILFDDLEASIRYFGITHLSLTPTVAALIDPKAVPSVNFLVTAGEGVTNAVHSSWAGKGLHQGYGPSETTNICSINMDVSPEDTLDNIGPPLRNTSAFVISAHGDIQVLPLGALGELAFGGEQVFPGYMSQEELNASKIIHHPRYGRMYRSGDLGRILPNGTMLISGRLDDQVKVRGNRIELGEISSVLLRSQLVQDCTTLILGQDAATQSIATFIVPATQLSSADDQITRAMGENATTQLFEILEQSLPSYMVPNTITVVRGMPRTSQGKLDKRLLRDMLLYDESAMAKTFGHENGDLGDDNDRSIEENKIADMLAKTLRIDSSKIARRAPLASFGMNSLNAIFFARQLSRGLNACVSVGTVLGNTSVARLARAIEAEKEGNIACGRCNEPDLLRPEVVDGIRSLPLLRNQPIECILPCTPLQEAMLSASAASLDNAGWNTLTLQVHGDVPRMKNCWQAKFDEHGILRTRFLNTNDRQHPFVQVVLKTAKLPWNDVQMSPDASLERSSTRLPGTGHNLTLSSFYVDCFSQSGNTFIVLHMHHAIYDGLSLSRLLEEVEAEYAGLSSRSTASFATFLQEVTRHSGQEAIAYWSEELKNFSPQPLHLLPQQPHSNEHTIQRKLRITSKDLNRLCKRHSVSQLAVFQTALVKTLALLQDISDVCFGNVVSGRTVPVEGVEDLIAPCFNTIPVRIQVRENDSNIQVASQLNRKNIEALRYQLTPVRRIQTLSRSPSKHLFECLLILQPPQKPMNSEVWTIEDESGDIGMPLAFELVPRRDDIEVILHYLERYITNSDARRLWEIFSIAVFSCLRYPAGSMKDFGEHDTSKVAGLLAVDENTNTKTNGITKVQSLEYSDDEILIRNVLARLTGLSKEVIKRDTSMFQIGLDSLNAPQIAAQLRSQGIEVDAGDILECLTPAAIAGRARTSASMQYQDQISLPKFDKKHRRNILRSLRVSSHSIEAVWPCTPVQSGMISQTMQSNGELYINHITYRVPRTVSASDIQNAWSLLSVKYQVLRMGFHKVDETNTPFAMSIFRQNSAPAPFFEHHEKVSIKDAERQAMDQITRHISKQPWFVQTIRQNDELLMTLSLHHSLYDADSLKLILDDFARATGSNDLSDVGDIKAALIDTLNAALGTSKARETFWSTALQDASFSKFPDLAPTVVTSSELEYEDHELDVSFDTIEHFCKTHNTTVQALGQTVWAMILAAYIGDNNVVFGTIFSGHPASDRESAAFPSITTIPIPCDTSCSTLELLGKMTQFNASAHRHRFMPLAELQRLSGSDNNSTFDTVFVHQRARTSAAGFHWKVVAETASVDYVASLELQSSHEGSNNLRLTFRVDRIPSLQARLILRQYEHLLKQLISDQRAQPASLYSILPMKQIEIPSEAPLLHQMVEKTASKYPDRTAFTFVENGIGAELVFRSWTYAQLNGRANQVANLIYEAGISPGSIVAVCMQKSPEASFAFLGILKAGCSFLAIDPDLPRSRLEFILEDSDAKLLFIDKDESRDLRQDLAKCVELDCTLLERYTLTLMSTVEVSPETTCYCLYTSGTTGTPKGCEVAHENAVQAMMSFQRLFAGHWTEDSRWLQFASYWFDVSVLEQFWSWGVGIEVVGAPRDVVLEDLPGFISRQKITHIDLTPSLARLVQPEDVPSLFGGVFITGGEALKQEIINAWGPKTTICNGYGPTEATIGVTMNTFIGQDAKPTNIGRQFDNVGTFVLRPQSDEPVLRGAVGELCVSGKLVGKGYLNRAELTEAQFPTLSNTNVRVYRTGDLVRLLADGSFSFIGRQDSQVKLRGQRLETSEIDTVMQNCSTDVAHAITLIAKAGPANKETLVAYLTKEARSQGHELVLDHADDALQLVRVARQACVDRLPGYMVPTHMLPINFLPLTVNNKVDTKRLLQLFANSSTKDLQALSESGDDATSMNAFEQRIAATLCELLSIGHKDITAGSNLFSIGLSSISAITFASLLKKKGFKGANIALVMSNPTIKQLSVAIEKIADRQHRDDDSIEQAKLSLSAFTQRYIGSAARTLGVSIDEIEAVAPCTPLQQGLVFDSTKLDHHPYFNDFCYIIDGVDIHKLRNALRELVKRTQMLRAHFIDTDNGTIQVVLKRKRAPLIEWSETTSSNLASHLHGLKSAWIDENKHAIIQPFEVHLVSTQERCYLKIHIHHAIYDGISFDLLLRDLCDLYKNRAPRDQIPTFIEALPYGPLQQLKSAKEFWQTRFQDCPRKAISPLQTPAQSENITMSTTIDTTEIEAVRKRLGVSHQAVMQGCFEIATRRCIPSINAYGTVVSGRSVELSGADRIRGPMFNTLPQPLRLATTSTLEEHIRVRHDDNVGVLPYQHTPLRDIRKWLSWNSLDSIFDVLFVFQHSSESARRATDSLLQQVNNHPEAQYPLSCEIDFSDSGITTILVVALSKYFEQGDVQSLLEGIQEVMQCLAKGLDVSLSKRFDIGDEPVGAIQSDGANELEHVNGVQHFEWTPSSLSVRSEMAVLLHLDESEIDEHSTIFSLGLDSIDAVKLVSRLRKAGLTISVSKILKAQTIARIMDTIERDDSNLANGVAASEVLYLRRQLETIASDLYAGDPQGVETILPATPTQEALVADMYRTELREYFNHDVLRLRSGTDIEKLKHAWQTVVDHSAIFRTIFVEVPHPDFDTVHAQVVLKNTQLDFKSHECKGVDDFEAIFDRIRVDVLHKLCSRPPLRLTILNVNGDQYLVLSLAHAQYDGHSLVLLHEDVRRAYFNSLTSRPSCIIPLEAAVTSVSDEALRFWTDTLSGAVTFSFPQAGLDDEASQTHRVERSSTISTSAAREFCKRCEVSMQALAQTCWAVTLAHYTRRMEVTFGVVLACRDSNAAEEVMFPTMNTIALRASLHGTRAQMVQSVQSFGTEMHPYQRTPLRAIRVSVADMLRTSDNSPANGLFDTLFIYQHKPSQAYDAGEPLYDSVSGSSSVAYPVAVEMEASDGEFVVIRAACGGSVLDEVGTEQLVEIVDEVLSAIINAPEEPTVDFDGGEVSVCGMESFYLDEFRDDDNENEPDDADGSTNTESSPTTSSIIEAFSQISKMPTTDITPSTTIESIGIDSISAIKLAALLRRQDIYLSVSEILRAKTPSWMTEVLKTKKTANSAPEHSSKDIISTAIQSYLEDDLLSKSGIKPETVETVLPATAGQVYMLSMWQKTHGQLFYPTFQYQIKGDVDVAVIDGAWKSLAKHHSISRTVLCATGDRSMPALQVVLRSDVDPINPTPMASLKAEKNEEGCKISLSIHHALYDAVSLPLLLHDLKLLLSGKSLSSPSLTFEDFIAPTASHRAKQLHKHFWSDYLDNMNSLTLGQPEADGPQKKVNIFRPALINNTNEFEKIGRKWNLSIQSLLFAAYAKVYATLTTGVDSEKGDVVLGIYLSNRSHLPDLETLAAPTVNLVPLLARAPQQSSVLDIAKEVQQDLQKITGVEQSAVGLWEIEQWTGVKIDTFVNFLKLPEVSDGRNDDKSVSIQPLDTGRLQERSHVVEPEDLSSFEVPKELEGMRGVEAYQHSLDIEMAITNNDLAVGLFCPESMIGLERAEKALDEFKTLLEKFVGKSKE